VVEGLVFAVGLAVAALASVPSSAHASQTLATFWQQMSLTQEFRQFTVFRQPAKIMNGIYLTEIKNVLSTSIGPCADGASLEIFGPAAFPVDANVPADNAEASVEAFAEI
jgi:hypothetical protein